MGKEQDEKDIEALVEEQAKDGAVAGAESENEVNAGELESRRSKAITGPIVE